jgi:rhamnogalacturonyl hydrolase YesR
MRTLELSAFSLVLAASCRDDDRKAAPEGAASDNQGNEEQGAGTSGAQSPDEPASLDPAEVEETVLRVANWQLLNPYERDPRHWSMAVLYEGLMEVSLTTGHPLYLAAVVRAGLRVQFVLGSRTYHADGHAAGHAWLRIYLMAPDRDPQMLEPYIEQFDEIVENPILAELSFLHEPPPGLLRTDRWTWADALYMSPPTVSLLAYATGDERYLDWMDMEYAFAYDALYDREDHLFYRDATYIDDLTPNGEKVFWSRGNAWVYAGLALSIDWLPPQRDDFYIELFQEMSEAILAAQQPDGAWYPSLMDPEHAPIQETSSSALFVFGMTWGMRRGYLDVETYWPVVVRGWTSILTSVQPDGAVEFVQPPGEAPELFDPTSRAAYGTGAVLIAGTEILRYLGAAHQVAQRTLLEQALLLVDEAPDLSTICDDCVAP